MTFFDFDMTAPKPTPGKMKKLLPCPGLNSFPWYRYGSLGDPVRATAAHAEQC